MEDPGLVCNLDGGCGLGRDLGGSSRKKPSLRLQDLPQRPAGDQLHHHVVGVAVLSPVIDGDDVGMTEVCRGLRLSPEPGYERVVGGEVGVEDLDRHPAVEHGVLGLVHIGHATTRQVRDKAIPV